MNNFELDCILKQNSTVSKCYTNEINTYDTLPSKLKPGYFYIFNTKSANSNHSSVGHWVIFLTKATSLTFIDSFGERPTEYIYSLMLKYQQEQSNNCNLYFNNVTLQADAATSCGLHSIVFATTFSYDYTVRDTLKYVYNVDEGCQSNDLFFFDKKAQKFVYIVYNEYRSIFFSI